MECQLNVDEFAKLLANDYFMQQVDLNVFLHVPYNPKN